MFEAVPSLDDTNPMDKGQQKDPPSSAFGVFCLTSYKDPEGDARTDPNTSFSTAGTHVEGSNMHVLSPPDEEEVVSGQ